MLDYKKNIEEEISLDPENWIEMETVAINMVKDMFTLFKSIRKRNVWTSPTEEAKQSIKLSLDSKGSEAKEIYEQLKSNILPFFKGNIHPCYWAWVEGTGSPFAMMGDMLAAGMNSNSNNGDHIAMYVENEVLEWLKKVLKFPINSGGSLVGGGSMANITALIVARNTFTRQKVRKKGIAGIDSKLVIYTSTESHSSVIKAAEILGIGSESVRVIPTNNFFQLNTQTLQEQIEQDKIKGYTPFCVVANVGSVKTGAIDPVQEIFKICKKEKIWFHVDGAFGVFAKLIPQYQQQLKIIEQADSIAFDLHKWMYIPYGIGCVFIKDKKLLKESFAIDVDYLTVHDRGLAAGPEPLSNLGVEMSRGFKSLKVWMAIKENGLDKYVRLIKKNISQALYLSDLIKKSANIELLTPVVLNIVCFRFNPQYKNYSLEKLNSLNKELLMLLHERGKVAPSYTILNGKYAIRVANVNHRSQKQDFELLLKEVLEIGFYLSKKQIH